MQAILPDLYRVQDRRALWCGDARNAYLLVRPQGNVLLYHTPAVLRHDIRVRQLGGVARQYLNHPRQASRSTGHVARNFGARLCVPREVAPAVRRKCPVAQTFAGDTRTQSDFHVVATPGGPCFLWIHAGRRLLFTGKLLRRDARGRWSIGVRDADVAAASLAKLRTLEVDALLPSRGEPVLDLERQRWRPLLDELADAHHSVAA